MLRFLLLSLGILAIAAPRGTAQDSLEPVVARLEMKLTLGEKVLDTIEPGDLLTVLQDREKSYVIQTFNGHKGTVAKETVAKLAEAAPIYDRLIAAQPEEGRLYTLRASCHWALGDNAQALADFDQAIALGYEAAHAYASRGLFHAARGNYDQAIEDYTTAIERDEKDEVAWLNRASVYMSTGQYEQAVEDYTRAIALRPENPVLYTQRAIAHKFLQQMPAAVKDYDRAIELAEKDVSAWMGRGFVKFQLGQHQAAIEDFSQVIELSPDSAVAINNRGYNYQMLGQEKRALADFRRAVELAPKYLLALQNLGWMLTIAKDTTLREPQAAITTATAVCEISQYKDFSDLTLLAAAYAAAGEFEKAIGWQEKASQLATAEQQPIAAKVLALYQAQRPLDPALLEPAAAERPPRPQPASE